MAQTNISVLAPVFALAFWTLCILAWVGITRIRAALSGRLVPRDLRLGESNQLPDDVVLANRNYMNLLELPLLFYLVSVVLLLTGGATPLTTGLQWTYVGLRVLHSLVHLSYNEVMHRFAAFALSNVVLLGIWVLTAVHTFV
jgi:hypothetical protein